MTAPRAASTAVADAQLRFLRAIADRVAVERVAEVYLFPPMRQGLVESGVGVVAVLPEDESGLESIDGAASSAGSDEDAPEDAVEDFGAPLDVHATREGSGGDGDAASKAGAPESASASGVGDGAGSDVAALDDAGRSPDGGEVAVAGAPPQQHDGTGDETEPDRGRADRPRTMRTGGRRSTIYSARYRLTLKGPDRGKWEVEVRAEADAPLVTVDAVIRGIQRRAPGEADAERLTGDAFRDLVDPPPTLPGAAAT